MLVAGARILILDEPTAVLTEEEAQRLLGTLREVAQRGAAVILVTHKLRDVRDFAHRVTVMRAGRTVATLNVSDATPQELTTLTVGSNVVTPSRSTKPAGEPRLIVTKLASSGAGGHSRLVDATFFVRAGEIYGVAGVGGNGQTELVAALIGGHPADAGSIEIKEPGSKVGIQLTNISTRKRRNLGLAVVPADRLAFALASSLSVIDNFAVGFVHEGKFGSVARVDRAAMRRAACLAIEEFDVQGVRSLSQRVGLLSGGNAQKLISSSRTKPKADGHYCSQS